MVQAYDVSRAARSEIESLGARAVVLPLEPGEAGDSGGYARDLGDALTLRQQELLAPVVAAVDVVITTASVPGKPAPVLVTEEAVQSMAAGSVVVDAAAEWGENCALTRPGGHVVTGNGVTILGPTNLASGAAHDASVMYAKT